GIHRFAPALRPQTARENDTLGFAAVDIQALYSQMQQRNLSARVVRYTHAVLSSALKQAVRWGMLYRNPAELVRLPRQQRKEMRALSPKESSLFWRHFRANGTRPSLRWRSQLE